jgi:hypothetical protein
MHKLRNLTLLLGLALCAGTTLACATEQAAPVSAKAIWGDRVQGKGYKIQDKVETEGVYRLYVLETRVGSFSITSDALLALRLDEYAAFERLMDDSGFAQFVGSFGTSAIAPLKFGGQLLTSPIETAKKSASGIGNFFDQLSSSGENKDPERGSFMGGVLGTDSGRREVAAQVGVDPYTDFPPLMQRLQELAAARGIGGLSVSGAMMAIPGGTALPSMTATGTRTVVYTASSVGRAQALQDDLRSKTAGQIMRDSRVKLSALAGPKAVDAIMNNKIFTPSDILVIAMALEQIKARNTDAFLLRCAAVSDRTGAYLRRRQAEMYAGLHATLPIERFVDASGYMAAQLKDKRALVAMPADHIYWTERNRDDVARLRAALAKLMPDIPQGKPGTPNKMMVISGDYSPMAKTELTKQMWETARITLTSDAPPPPSEPQQQP